MKNNLALELINIFKKSINLKKINLHEPHIEKYDLNNLKKCISSNHIAQGNFIKKFEKKISGLTKSKYVVATSSGTSALHVSCLLLGVKKNDEVLIPSFTFVATANAVKLTGAKPILVDVDRKNLLIDEKDFVSEFENEVVACFEFGESP